MKPYPSVFHTYTRELRPMMCFLSQRISMRFPTAFRQPLTDRWRTRRIESEKGSRTGGFARWSESEDLWPEPSFSGTLIDSVAVRAKCLSI